MEQIWVYQNTRNCYPFTMHENSTNAIYKAKTFKLFTLCPFKLPKIDSPSKSPTSTKLKNLFRHCSSQNQGYEISDMVHRAEEGEVDAGRDDCHFKSKSHGR